jgi:HK97 family phage major capsid protein
MPTAMTTEQIKDTILSVVEPLLKRQQEEWEAVNAEMQKADPDPEAVLATYPDTVKSLCAPLTEERKEIIGGTIRALAAARYLDPAGSNILEKAIVVARDIHKDLAVVKSLQLQDLAAGGALVSEERLPGMIELLRARQVFRTLQPTIIPMVNGAASISKMTGGATGSYLGETQNIAKSEQTFGLLRLSEKKLAVLTPISNELLRVPSSGANQVVQEDLTASLGLTSDLAFISGSGTVYTPKGLYNWVPAANTLAANGTVNLANVTSDLADCVLRLLNGNCRMLRPGWLMAPRTVMYLMTIRDANGNFAFREEMLGGKLFGYPFAQTTKIPINLGSGTNETYIVFADFADVVVAESMTMEIDTSSEAAYYDGSAVQAAFSRDETVIRAIEKHDLGVRHEESVARITAVIWVP